MKKQKLYAFWRYNTFPYVLGGRVIDINGDGTVECQGYAGFNFHPIKILPEQNGVAIREGLETLKKDREAAQKAFNESWDAALTKFLNETFKDSIKSPHLGEH